MKIGMNLLLWTGGAGEEHIPLLKNIASWGFDGVELPMFAHDGSPWKKLATVLDDLGQGRTVVSVLPQGANLIGEEAGERKAAVEFLKKCVDSCKTLGADALAGPICSPVGRLVGRGPNESEKKWAAEGLRMLGEYAKGAGIAISVEPLNRFETYFINTQADSSALIDAVGLENVGILYDTFHANIEEKSVNGAITHAGKRINHIHISANDRGTPGEDHVHWDDNFSAMKEIGYDGWLTIESFGSWLPDLAAATCIWRKLAPSEEHIARRGCEFIKKHWNR